MALCHVAILYAPTVVLRLPAAPSLDSYMIRRFACVLVSSAASVVLTASLIGIGRFRDLSWLLGVFGIRVDHKVQKGAVTIAFAAGAVCFFRLLFQSSSLEGCHCWHGYCSRS